MKSSRYKQIPIVTRGYLTLAVGTTLLCALDVVSPFSLYFNYTAIAQKYEVTRSSTLLYSNPPQQLQLSAPLPLAWLLMTTLRRSSVRCGD